MEVYADIIFFVNFFMDLFIFWAVGKLFSKNILKSRLFLGAFLASILYCFVIFVDFLKFLFNPVGFFLILAVSVFVTFKPQEIMEFLKNIFAVVVVSFVAGGIATAIFYFFNLYDFIGNTISVCIKNFSLKLLIFSSAFFYIVIKIVVSLIKRSCVKKQIFYDVNVFWGEKKATLRALVDTGNSLREPISRKSVIIAEINALKKILPWKVCEIYFKDSENKFCELYEYVGNSEDNFDFRIIPFSSIGAKNGIILGFFADRVEILANEHINIENAIIGICDFELAKNGKYNALLSPELLEE